MSNLLDGFQFPADHRYRIRQKIGEGGMSTVFLAEDRVFGSVADHINITLALKFLDPKMCRNNESVARFTQEATILAALRGHPNILTLYDVQRTILPNQSTQRKMFHIYYLVLQYFKHGSCEQYIRKGQEGRASPLSQWKILAITRDILRALSFAHSQGYMHRDVKPDNILIGDHGQYVLADFGIAQGNMGVAHTRAGSRMGSPEYMAPEQARDPTRISETADIYALGVTMLALALGKLPPKRLRGSQMFPASELQPITEPLRGIIVRATQWNPGKRFPAAEAMLQEIEARTSKGVISINRARPTTPKPSTERLEKGSSGGTRTEFPSDFHSPASPPRHLMISMPRATPRAPTPSEAPQVAATPQPKARTHIKPQTSPPAPATAHVPRGPRPVQIPASSPTIVPAPAAIVTPMESISEPIAPVRSSTPIIRQHAGTGAMAIIEELQEPEPAQQTDQDTNQTFAEFELPEISAPTPPPIQAEPPAGPRTPIEFANEPDPVERPQTRRVPGGTFAAPGSAKIPTAFSVEPIEQPRSRAGWIEGTILALLVIVVVILGYRTFFMEEPPAPTPETPVQTVSQPTQEATPTTTATEVKEIRTFARIGTDPNGGIDYLLDIDRNKFALSPGEDISVPPGGYTAIRVLKDRVQIRATVVLRSGHMYLLTCPKKKKECALTGDAL